MAFKKEKYYEFRFDSVFGKNECTGTAHSEFIAKAIGNKGYNMVIAKGNMFLKGVYVSTKEMKNAHKGFNNTMHDLNHFGSGYIAHHTVIPSDISYIVGWQDGLLYDDATDEVRANVHIKTNSPRYNEWKNYIDISSKIGRNPNVSMFVFAKVELIEARELPANSRYRANGYRADDLVPCMVNIQPFMVSTVVRGSCDDTKGCGIKKMSAETVTKILGNNEQKMKYFRDRLKSIRG